MSAASESTALVVRASRLVKSFGAGEPVLRGVDLEVSAGEWVAVMGPSGSGKSTLLHPLAGLDTPTAGRTEIAGVRVDGLGESARARVRRRSAGVIYQAYNLVPHLTALDNVALPIRLAGGSRREAHRRAAALLARLGIADLAGSLPGTMSGGQAQRVAVARAVANEVPLLLADEPTGALDSAAARLVIGMLRQLHSEGTSIVMITHDQRVAAAADRVVFILDGRVVNERVLAGDDAAANTSSSSLPFEAW